MELSIRASVPPQVTVKLSVCCISILHLQKSYVDITRLANSKFKPSPAVLSVATIILTEGFDLNSAVASWRLLIVMSPWWEVSKVQDKLGDNLTHRKVNKMNVFSLKYTADDSSEGSPLGENNDLIRRGCCDPLLNLLYQCSQFAAWGHLRWVGVEVRQPWHEWSHR